MKKITITLELVTYQDIDIEVDETKNVQTQILNYFKNLYPTAEIDEDYLDDDTVVVRN